MYNVTNYLNAFLLDFPFIKEFWKKMFTQKKYIKQQIKAYKNLIIPKLFSGGV